MKSIGKKAAAILAILLIFQCSLFVENIAADRSGNTASISAETVEAFLEGIIPGQLEKNHLGGAAVAVVKDGKLIFSKGYGYADISQSKRVAADRTLFRVGSITKLFTWTAVMQLVEQGKLDLDADINCYLDGFKIPDKFGKPVTLKNLLTHTSGFEDRLVNLHVESEKKLVPLAEMLKKDTRDRLFAPGEIVAYSNYGTALAGYIVEKVSGVPFEEYIEENILKPLDMTHTTLDQPVPAEMRDDLALGHQYGKSGYTVKADPYTRYAPTGAMSTTAVDISKFMLAHLQKGRYLDRQILREETTKLMQLQHYASDPQLPGICYGFMEWKRNNKRIIWHSGGTARFKSLLMLIPEDNLGLFISYNSPNAEEARGELRQAFLDAFYPTAAENAVPMEGYAERVKRYTGEYMEARTSFKTSDKMIYWFSRMKTAKANKDGTLSFRDTTYVEVGPLVFREINGQGTLIFKQDAKGNIIRAFQDYEPHEAYFRLKWYQTLHFQMTVLIFCLLVFAAEMFIKRRRKQLLDMVKPLNKSSLRILGIIVALNLLFWAGALISAGIEVLLNPTFMLIGGTPAGFRLCLLLPALTIMLLPSAAYYGVRVWQSKQWPYLLKLQYTLAVLAAVVFVLWLKYWNLLGFII